jgi:hypothetical protein
MVSTLGEGNNLPPKGHDDSIEGGPRCENENHRPEPHPERREYELQYFQHNKSPNKSWERTRIYAPGESAPLSPGSLHLVFAGKIEFMDKNQWNIIAGCLRMILEADEFHLKVAKGLLGPQPLSEQEKAALRDEIAKRESRHEQVELLLKQVIETVNRT